MEIAVLNLKPLLRKLDKLATINVAVPVKEGAQEIEKTAKELAPVDTGALRRSIRVRALNGSYNQGAIISAGSDSVNYAIFQEFGTSLQSGTPFMIPAFLRHEKEIWRKVEKYVNDRINKS